nr:hypothetical protein RAR13_09170 [Aminobacter aminovorans]
MYQTHSKSRQQAEIAFSRAQSQFFARNNPVAAVDVLVRSRAEKTLRLRQARLAKELHDRAGATAIAPGPAIRDQRTAAVTRQV